MTIDPNQFGYAVQDNDNEGGYTIQIYFHTAMVNNKKQLFWLFSLVVCVACKIFILLFLHGAASSFQSSTKNKNKNKFLCGLACRPAQNCLYLFLYAAILLSIKVTIYLGKSKPASKVTLNNNTQSNVESHNGNIVALNGYYCLLI